MADKTGKLIARLEEGFGLERDTLATRGLQSVFDIAQMPRGEFIRNHHEALPDGVAGDLYDRAMGYAQQLAFAYRQDRQVAARAPGAVSNPGPSYVSQFDPDWRAMTAGDAIDANTSPAAYLTSLYKLVLQQEARAVSDFNPIAKRRPDIPKLLVDEDAVNKVVPALEIVNNILGDAIQSSLPDGKPTDEVLASTFYPNSLPYHFAYEQAWQGMLSCDTTLGDVKLLADPAWPYFDLKSYGDEQVNSYTQGDQTQPAISALKGEDGGWVVVWQSNGQDGSDWGIYQQRYSRSGVKVGPETRVNTTTVTSQSDPSVSGLNDGGWIVVWESSGQTGVPGWNVCQQRYDNNGLPVSDETQVNTTTVKNQYYGKVAGLENGGWVVVWQGNQDGLWKIYQQCFDSAGKRFGSETRVNDLTGSDQYPSVASLAGGGWVVVWFSGKDVYQRSFDAEGNALGGQAYVEYASKVAATADAVARLEDGGWIVVYDNDYGSLRMRISRYTGSGSREFQRTLANGEYHPSCTALKDGGWIVAWAEGTTINQLRYDHTGTIVGDVGVVNENATNPVASPKLAGLPDGGWVVVWAAGGNQDGSGWGIYQQRFDGEGNPATLRTGHPAARSVEENGALRIGSTVSPALRDTVEHEPYFATLMYYVTGIPGEKTFPSPLGQGAFFNWNVCELTPWYPLNRTAFVMPPQSGVASGPTGIIDTPEKSAWDTTLTLNNIGVAKKITVKAVNYLRVWIPSANTYAYSLNNTYIDPVAGEYADLVQRVPTFGFNISGTAVMPSDGCVSFFIRMYDAQAKRYWTEISYTFASTSYNGGNLYTNEQLEFYARNFGTKAEDVVSGQYYADMFKDVDKLTGRTGLSVTQLEAMLSTRVGGDRVVVSPNIVVRNALFTGAAGVAPVSDQTTHEPYHYGAVYLHGGKRPALWLSADDNDKLTLNELTDDRMDRMNRIVRLQRLLDIPFDQLDYLVTAGMHAEGISPDKADGNLGLHMNANTTRLLGVFNYYQQRYGVTAEQFAAITDQITPYAIAPGIPLLDRVFNRKTLFDQAYSVDWQPVDPAANTPRDIRIMRQLAAGLGISDGDMRFLATQILAMQTGTTFENSLATITSFYRIVMLSRWFGLDVTSFMQLVQVMDASYDGIALKQHLLGAPVILPVENADQPRRDWLDWLLLVSIAADWLARTGLSVGEIATPLNEASFGGTQGRLDFVGQLRQATIPTLVTDNLLLHADLPRVDTDGNPINWIALLGNPGSQIPSAHPLIDAKGLVLDGGAGFTLGEEQIKASVKAIVDAQKLSQADKDKTGQVLGTLIYTAQQTQNGMLGAMVAQSLSCDQGMVLSFCRWANITPYRFLALVLTEPDQLQAADSQVLNRILSLFAQYAHLASFYELSPAMLDTFVRHRRWFADNTGPQVLLPTHFSLASYRDWLHRTTLGENDLLDVLAIGNKEGLDSETFRDRLARTLGWDKHSVGTALDQIVKSPNDPRVMMLQIAAVMRLQDLSQQTGLTVEDLIGLEALELESDYASWRHLGQAIVVGASRAAMQ